jgi:secreted trypsin-like serine protease
MGSRTRIAIAAFAATCWVAAPAAAEPVGSKSVVGGRLASIADFPYSAVVLKDGRLHCSGVVVSPTRVLTAGHCVKPAASRLAVLTGSDRARPGSGQVLGVATAVRHPAYDEVRKARIIYNDIAVIALAAPTSAPAIALPAPAQDAGLTAPGSTLTLAAYGERNPTLLQRARIGRLASGELAVRSGCERIVKGFAATTMICAQGDRIGTAGSGRKRLAVHRSGCFGDSGGPLVGQTATGPAVLGVTSFGKPSPKDFRFVLCGLRRKPGIYTRVVPYIPWIQSNL